MSNSDEYRRQRIRRPGELRGDTWMGALGACLCIALVLAAGVAGAVALARATARASEGRRLAAHIRTQSLTPSPVGARAPWAPPPAPASGSAPSDVWLPAGQAVSVAGRWITGGLLYVGEGLPAVHGIGPEPALINPRLPVGRQAAPHATDLGYWPSYDRLSPECRATYLDWLVDGRRNPSANIGYVFLYFYGLERRLLWDAVGQPPLGAERKVLLAELQRLRSIYRGNGSFDGYSLRLMEMAELLGGEPSEAMRAPVDPPPIDEALLLRYGLGWLVRDGLPIPWDWALAWWMAHPETYLRTPSQRCRDEFRKLFRIRYAEAYGPGIKVAPNTTPLTIEYRPASASFAGQSMRLSVGDLPDVARLTAPVRRIAAIAEACEAELEPYSRWIGRNPGALGTDQALLRLPRALAAQGGESVERLRRDLCGDHKLGQFWPVLADRVLEASGCKDPTRTTKAEAVAAAEALEVLGLGMEPDIRFGGPKLVAGDTAVLFHLPPGSPSAPSSTYTAAALALHLFLVIAQADGKLSEDERAFVAAHLRANPGISEPERVRLTAHSAWLLRSGAGLKGLKRRAGGLDTRQSRSLRQFLVSVAAIDGQVSPSEIDALRRAYSVLGFDPAEVHGDVHALCVPGDERFATLVEASPEPRGYAVPPPATRAGPPELDGYAMPAPLDRPAPLQPPAPSVSVQLDMDKVRSTLAATSEVAALLSDVLADEEPALPAEPCRGPDGAESAVAGLDGRHSALVRALVGRTGLGRDEFASLAEGFGLLPDGALDRINEAAYEICDAPLVDGDENLAISPQVLEEMLA